MNIIGIDISKEKFDCVWIRDLEANKVKSKVFKNCPDGHKSLLDWAVKNMGSEPQDITVLMEATGVYHEALAYYLHNATVRVAVLNPARVRDYAKSLGSKTKNDKRDAMVIARYGATQSLALWQPEPESIRSLKALLARLDAVEKDIQREGNRMEKATVSGASSVIIDSIQSVLDFMDEEKKRLNKIINDHIDSDPILKKDMALLKSIPGVGDVVSRHMMAIYHSRNFQRASQMAAYLGVVPIEYQSGSSIKGRPRLSKAGSSVVRAKLYLPAVVATRHNPQAMALYQRLLSRGKAKMAAIGAVMRKLVHMCFGVLKHQQAYSPQAA